MRRRFFSLTHPLTIYMAISLKNELFCCCKQRWRTKQRNQQKTRKRACDINKSKNVDVFNEKNETRCDFSPILCQKWNAATMFFVILDRTGRSFVKCFCGNFFKFLLRLSLLKNEVSCCFSFDTQDVIFISLMNLREM